MNNNSKVIEANQQPGHGSLKSYTAGFLISLVLTLIAYFLVANHILGSEMLIITIVELALIQLLVQLVFFLHLGLGAKSRWNIIILLSTVSIILIIVLGSVWIMSHLNYNMMPGGTENYIMKDEGIQK